MPSFDWVLLDNLDKIGLKIDFHDGCLPDTAVLSSVDNINLLLSSYLLENDCIFNGNLESNPDNLVSVSGCPWAKRFEV